jgi:hypothetical protein
MVAERNRRPDWLKRVREVLKLLAILAGEIIRLIHEIQH